MGETNDERIKTLFNETNTITLNLSTINFTNLKAERLKQAELRKKSEEEKQRQKEKTTYDYNYSLLEKIAQSYLDNFENLGFRFDSNYIVTEINPKSPASKAGLKIGNIIEFQYENCENFTIQEMIDSLDLSDEMKKQSFSSATAKQYIKEYLNEKTYILENKIFPLEKGDSITFIVNNGKKKKTITLTIPNEQKKK